MATDRNSSPYSASFTGCSFMFYEFNRVLPLLLSPEADVLLKKEIKDRGLIQVNSEIGAKRIIAEFRKRFDAVSLDFWKWYEQLSEKGQRAALFYCILKCYRLIFDFHVNLTMRRWNSTDHSLSKNDVMMEYYQIASQDQFVDSWSEKTRGKITSAYLTILRQAGLLDANGQLQPLLLDPQDYRYYIIKGEDWFLDACLLLPYEKENIIKALS